MTKRCKTLIGLYEVAGYGFNLYMGMKEIGNDCEFITLTHHPFSYDNVTQDNGLIKLIKNITNKNQNKINKIATYTSLLYFHTALLIYALFKYERFIFLSNHSFLFLNIDLAILRLFRKKVIMVFVGSDVRPLYMSGSFVRTIKDMPLNSVSRKIKRQFLSIRLAELFSNERISIGTITQFLHRPFIDWMWVGIPVEPGVLQRIKEKGNSGHNTLRILHSPSNRFVKGSDCIKNMIDKMKQNGFSIDYLEITDKPHSEIISALNNADLVIDQMYSDTPMATFATEAAQMNVPALVGGYFARMIRCDDPNSPPTIICTPDEMEIKLETFLENPDRLWDYGAKANNFVINNWSRKMIASRFLSIFNSETGIVYRDPKDYCYVEGAGISLVDLTDAYGYLFEHWGENGFMLGDRKDLLSSILKIIK